MKRSVLHQRVTGGETLVDEVGLAVHSPSNQRQLSQIKAMCAFKEIQHDAAVCVLLPACRS